MHRPVDISPAESKKGLTLRTLFTTDNTHPFDKIRWVTRDAGIIGSDGKEKFSQKGVEVPEFWNETTTNIVAEKYFRKVPQLVDGDLRLIKETSAKQMFLRVAGWIGAQGIKQGVFDEANEAIFRHELLHMLVNGMHAFNSPVWFNVGVIEEPQCSACFINSVDDTIDSITDLAKREVRLFKGGSGTGTNLSPLRSSWEKLSGGGNPSGPVSFMRYYDAGAGVTKSGGTTRRAAKMVILNVDHPDILEQRNGEPGFISCKAQAEKVAHDLYSTGSYTAEWNIPGNIYDLVGYQNANNSVRVPFEFMRAVEQGLKWQTKEVTTGKVVHEYNAADLMHKIAEAAWFCGDPGMQFDTTINEWHTCPNSGRINGSNPCCFVGETLIETSEGRIEIRRLVEMVATGQNLPLALSYDFGQRLPVAKKIKAAWKAGDAKVLVRVSTERGLSFLCTPEHRWYLRDGSVVEAKDLLKGQRFAKLNFWRNQARSNRRAVNHRGIPTAPKGTVWFNRWLWEQANGEIPEGWEVHHKNENAEDDRLSNYELVDGTAHKVFHSTGEKNPRFLDVPVATLVEIWETIEATPRLTHKKKGNSVTPGRWNLYVRDHNLVGQVPLAQSPTLGGNIQGMAWEDFAAFIEENKSVTNDRVEAIEILYLDSPVPVYDIEVEETHNFGISCPGFEHALVVSNSEYMFSDDTACNLSSLNLLKFARGKEFDVQAFVHACEIATIAKEIIVDAASYPSPLIAKRSHDFRTLGLGFTNLGALLVHWGLPYDSNEGRSVTAAITAIMNGAAYRQSAVLAAVLGPFPEYEKNREPMLKVIRKHWDAAKRLPTPIGKSWQVLTDVAVDLYSEAYRTGERFGYRNAQVTNIAPTGTISFLMGADTTGIEPMLAFVVYKKIVGEGLLVMPNSVVGPALENLGYSEEHITGILSYIRQNESIHGAPGFNPKHENIFAEALGPHAIRPEAHVDMMAAVQPFVSGSISKTVNLPHTATVQDIEDIFLRAWRGRLKCVAVYRDGCKLSQPISKDLTESGKAKKALSWGQRRPLPPTRKSITHKFSISQQDGYLTFSQYESDGTLAEIFVRIAKSGASLQGMIDAFCIATSMALQSGVPFDTLKDKFIGMRFDPEGFTEDPHTRICKSIVDYIFQWLDKYLNTDEVTDLVEGPLLLVPQEKAPTGKVNLDGPPCANCGNFTRRAGSCNLCINCGTTTGCS
jgi:ribonucleotide reductase alpha subunit